MSCKEPIAATFRLSAASFLAAALLGSASPVAAQETPAAGQSESRALPSPLPSPPFPGSDWLGAPIIGQPDTAPDWPLQRALFGAALDASRLKVYGWVSGSGNISSSKESNAPMAYDLVPDAVELDQLVLRVERMPDTVQTVHLDWGFRLTQLYGMDYRYTTMAGVFSDQLLKHNNLYGYDPVEAYGLIYCPKVAEGMVVRIGRYLSPPDIEDSLAPDNYVFSHSLMVSVDPSTLFGVLATIRLSPQWQLEAGVHFGNDTAPWYRGAALNGHLMARWVSMDGNDSLWGGINSLGTGRYNLEGKHDNLQMVVLTWSHRFSEGVHMATEAYAMWQYDAAMGGTPVEGPPERYYTNVGMGPIIPGRSTAVGVVNNLEVMLSPKDYLTVRTDYLDDPQGQRTGYATPYVSETVGWCHVFGPLFQIRPEIRYERALRGGVTPYDNGTRHDQLSLAMDFVLRF